MWLSLEAADDMVATFLYTAKKEETKIKAANLIYKRLEGYSPGKSVPVQIKAGAMDFAKCQKVKEKFETELLESLLAG